RKLSGGSSLPDHLKPRLSPLRCGLSASRNMRHSSSFPPFPFEAATIKGHHCSHGIGIILRGALRVSKIFVGDIPK
ncbi:hypothetical protein P4H46_28890, partial [Paenibacillus glucanolyticus]|uniref:hypothetical protein n=1 Tax=Paenibacillus glucanolyticus TaxID=59843 RepID=UPI0030C9BA1B